MTRLVVLSDDAGQTVRSDTAGVTVETIAGWHRSAPVVSDREKRLGDGSFTGPSTREGRRYVVRGVSSGLEGDAFRLEQRRIMALFKGLGAGTLTVVDGVEMTAEVRLDGEILVDDHAPFGWFRWEVPLWADDPLRHASPRAYALTPDGAGGGRQYPLTYPIEYGAGTSGGAVLTNGGTAAAWPVIEVRVDDPSGFVLDTGGRIVEVITACSVDAPITVDMRGSVTGTGGDITHMAGRREWASVPPGSATPITLTTMQGGPGYATATIRDAYI